MVNFASLAVLILHKVLSVVFRLLIKMLTDDEFEMLRDGNVQFYYK